MLFPDQNGELTNFPHPHPFIPGPFPPLHVSKWCLVIDAISGSVTARPMGAAYVAHERGRPPSRAARSFEARPCRTCWRPASCTSEFSAVHSIGKFPFHDCSSCSCRCGIQDLLSTSTCRGEPLLGWFCPAFLRMLASPGA